MTSRGWSGLGIKKVVKSAPSSPLLSLFWASSPAQSALSRPGESKRGQEPLLPYPQDRDDRPSLFPFLLALLAAASLSLFVSPAFPLTPFLSFNNRVRYYPLCH